ncbi:hypothetical protein [Alicyclobacillus macrosporangiidus]|uniref:Uncharacterized protein n=1 Tax=Alicyclobacillus macrosporangiidus TaxID=392015 RepID=A0A1I7KLZ6_9BACL|nr:hypothetical protein [Alicyclobacillus macrosporangiidus]SFU98426.1 hypothetical protein SAMN05421543_11719 [Alicyclobacillus macrosporangiidus]
MGWVYYLRLVDTRFHANCLKARFEAAEGWMYRRVPKYVGVFQTPRGRYGVKVLW